jgi:nicotinamide-nucleotide amidase
VFALPGVPAEMFRMWADSVAGAVAAMQDAPCVLYHRRIKCFGVGESDLEKMLPNLIRRGREPRVGITVSAATITLRITATGETLEAARAATDATTATIRDCLGQLVFGEDDDELENAVVRLLAKRSLTVGTVEWGTGGLLAHWLAEAAISAGGKNLFSGGVVATGEAARWNVTQAGSAEESYPAGTHAQPQAIAMPQEHGEIQSMVGRLAVGAKRLLKADYGLATGPLPEYDPAGSIVPEFWYALATPAAVSIRSSPYAGNPDILKTLSAKRALNWLRLELM